MTIATELLRQHVETLVDDPMTWQGLLAPEIVWELPFAAVLGHPTCLSGRDAVVRHAGWFVESVAHFRYFDLTIEALTDPARAVAEVKAEGIIKATRRTYRQTYIVFLRAETGKIAFLREYFDPVRAAQALDAPILELRRLR
ncbi:MAG TPA: nuclear transport factor 2 family protein [Vicinamibacterales bacterium]|nr:nuclear transport factor 2 family protein [Vicinamibacterales bacterium]